MPLYWWQLPKRFIAGCFHFLYPSLRLLGLQSHFWTIFWYFATKLTALQTVTLLLCKKPAYNIFQTICWETEKINRFYFGIHDHPDFTGNYWFCCQTLYYKNKLDELLKRKMAAIIWTSKRVCGQYCTTQICHSVSNQVCLWAISKVIDEQKRTQVQFINWQICSRG